MRIIVDLIIKNRLKPVVRTPQMEIIPALRATHIAFLYLLAFYA
jgi:hypothetical protein